MLTIFSSVGDVIGSNFKVPDRIAGTMEEERVVGASSSYGQPFIPARNQGSALPIRVSQLGRQGSNSDVEARGSEFDLYRENFFTELSIG